LGKARESYAIFAPAGDSMPAPNFRRASQTSQQKNPAPSQLKSQNTMHKTEMSLYARVMSNKSYLPTRVRQELINLVMDGAPSAKLFEHPASKTSEESMEARHKASGERVTGAKALLIKIDVREQPDAFAVIVLPGFCKLDSKALKRELRERIPDVKNFRFANPDEMAAKARGIQPGKMPPFGRPLFPDVNFTFIDTGLLAHKRIGFNAADFESSIIMDMDDYLKIVTHDGIFACSDE
jgi:prolyl-tRNA editing enzyme YbaK/EbsC (Cys-tRNA(Pro) deacylase)